MKIHVEVNDEQREEAPPDGARRQRPLHHPAECLGPVEEPEASLPLLQSLRDGSLPPPGLPL